MQTQFELLAAEVLRLTPDEREAFLQSLTASLDENAVTEDLLATELSAGSLMSRVGRLTSSLWRRPWH